MLYLPKIEKRSTGLGLFMRTIIGRAYPRVIGQQREKSWVNGERAVVQGRRTDLPRGESHVHRQAGSSGSPSGPQGLRHGREGRLKPGVTRAG